MSETGTATKTTVLRVTGFLGAGKTTIVRALTGEAPEQEAEAPAFQDREAGICGEGSGGEGSVSELSGGEGSGLQFSAIEASPFVVPGTFVPGEVIVTAVDAVNACANLADRDVRALVTGQIRAADLVVLTCGDVADPGPALRAIADLTDAPVIEAHGEDDLASAILDRARPGGSARLAATDHGADFTVWTYRGPAVLTRDAMTAFLQRRPAGAYRIRGAVRLGENGGRVDVFGAARRTSVIECPAETRLVVAGPARHLSARVMELAFTEAVTDAAYGRGVIACR